MKTTCPECKGSCGTEVYHDDSEIVRGLSPCDFCNGDGRVESNFIDRLKAKAEYLSNNYPYPIFREEKELLARIYHVLALRYSITRKNSTPKYRPYTIDYNVNNPL